jgi:probable addiction module antidote protein
MSSGFGLLHPPAAAITEQITMTKSASTSHDDAVACELRDDPLLTAEYLRAAIADSDEPRVLLVTLRQVAKALGMPVVARLANIERERLYRALSPKGNPRLSTIVAILRGVGLALSVEAGGVVAEPHRRVRVARGKVRRERDIRAA